MADQATVSSQGGNEPGAMPGRMRAMTLRRYGGPEMLRLEKIEKPGPRDGELLVRVMASSVNAVDWHFLRGKPVLVRLQYGFFRPRNRVLGYDVAGRVESVGRGVRRFKPGDEVFGGLDFGLGGFAEYARVRADGFVGLKPAALTFEQAGSVPGAAVAALIGLRDRGQVQAGQRVLINGASGGVGTYAVQIARALGAEVTGVCSARNSQRVLSIGAGRVIDYGREDFCESERDYDLLLDNVGNRSVANMLRVLRPGGRAVIVGFSGMKRMLQQSLFGPRAARKRGIIWNPPASGNPTREHIEALSDLFQDGRIVPQIERSYPLERLPEAIAYVETGHAGAKVAITI